MRMVRALLVGVLVLQLSCGTILYPERRGQKSGRLDIAVVLLDGLGLLLFVIPGIVAFAVDFATGAIYLPPEESSDGAVQEVRVPPEELTRERLEQILSERTGKPVKLTPGQFRAMRLEAIEQFTPQSVAQLEADRHAGDVIFPPREE